MTDPAAKPRDPGAAESLVGDILDKDRDSRERQKAADAPKKQRSWLGVLLPVTAICLVLTIWNPWRPNLTATPMTGAEIEGASALGVDIAISVVEAYRDSTGQLPGRLTDAFPHPLGVEYNLASNGTYTLTSGTGGNRIQYRSSPPRPDLSGVLGPLF